jgi:isocitrate dehydrogenase
LSDFLAEEIEKTKAEGVLFSLHMKATMMKVSDPIIFGHAVKAWLAPVFEKFGDKLDALGVTGNAGLGTLLEKVKDEPEIMAAIDAVMAERPPMYMVDSDRGHHQPARALGRHHRRLDARAHPRRRQGLGPGRQGT